MTDSPQKSIIIGIKAGSMSAFNQLFRLHYPSILAFIRGFVKDDEVAKDLAQDVFMKVWQYRHSLDESKPISRYMFLITRRHICNWYKKKLFIEDMMASMNATEMEKIVHREQNDEQDKEEMRLLAEHIISQMPQKRRIAFSLSRDGFTSKEIATKMGVGVRTVEKHIELARKQLKEEMKNQKTT